jgi:S1-C subfamily serine protease
VRGLTEDEAAAAGLAGPVGAIVTRTSPGSRAERSGLRRGDVIVGCNDAELAGAAALEMMVHSATLGQPMRFRVWRERQWVELALPAAMERP